MTTHSVSIRVKDVALAVLFLLAPAAFPQAPVQNVDRVFHFTYTDDVQSYRQMATVIRSIFDIKQLLINAENRTMTLRATPEQISAAEWLFKTLDRAAGSQATESPDYRMPGNDDDTVRIFYLTKAETVEALQQQATRRRSATGFRRAFTYNVLRALVVRGTAEQIAHAERLITEL